MPTECADTAGSSTHEAKACEPQTGFGLGFTVLILFIGSLKTTQSELSFVLPARKQDRFRVLGIGQGDWEAKFAAKKALADDGRLLLGFGKTGARGVPLSASDRGDTSRCSNQGMWARLSLTKTVK